MTSESNNMNITGKKNFCIKLDSQESDRLGFIMHEIHGILTSIDRSIGEMAEANLAVPRIQAEMKEKALETQRLSGDLRVLLDFLQISNSDNYFDNAVRRPQPLWSKFYYLNAYLKSVIRKKHLSYTLVPQPEYNRRSPIADYVGYPIINAITNILMDNAIKYSPDGDEIYCEFDDMSDTLVVTVENNGPYLTPDEIDRIYLCGMRGMNAGLVDANGHGYGMNFLKLIIEAHNGMIDVKSSHDYNLNGVPYGKFTCTITLNKYVSDEDADDDD